MAAGRWGRELASSAEAMLTGDRAAALRLLGGRARAVGMPGLMGALSDDVRYCRVAVWSGQRGASSSGRSV